MELTIVEIFCSFEEPRNIVLQYCQRLVQLLQDPDDGVALLHVVHRLLHGDLSVEPAIVITPNGIISL